MKYAELVESPECRSWGGASGRGSRCAGSRAPGGGRSAPSTRAPRRSPGHTPATQPTVGLTYKSTQSNYVFAGKVKVRVENEAASCPWSCS